MSFELLAREGEREEILRKLKMSMFRAGRTLDARLEVPVAMVCFRYLANPNIKSAKTLPDGFFFSSVLPTISDFSESEAEKLSMIADFAKMLAITVAASYHVDLNRKETLERQKFFRDNPMVN